MRTWHTNASIEADTRYSPVVRRAFYSRFVPMWLLNLITKYHG